MLDIGLITAAVIGVAIIYFIAKGLFIVQQSESVVVERLGSYNRTLGPGINFLIPVLERARPIKIRRYESAGIGSKELQERVVEETKIDTRETVLNFPSQPVVTNDNVSIQIDGALYFQIQSPKDAVYAVENLIQAVEVLAKTTLRAVVGERELDTLFSSRDEINNKLQTVMDEAGNKWGVKVNRVEIQD
ncbi:MAG TPA: paraslipin, partial [Gammaproteobacteria bacterium]|nr:paraslipin [Gammaproteobacteria bacterium]